MTTYGHAFMLTGICQPKQQGVLAAEILREVTEETATRKKRSTLGEPDKGKENIFASLPFSEKLRFSPSNLQGKLQPKSQDR